MMRSYCFVDAEGRRWLVAAVSHIEAYEVAVEHSGLCWLQLVEIDGREIYSRKPLASASGAGVP